MSKLPPDPVIDEIRRVRHEISARFDNDPKRLVDHYIELQHEYQDRLVKAAGEDARRGSRAVGEKAH